jgi:hypothetical protein
MYSGIARRVAVLAALVTPAALMAQAQVRAASTPSAAPPLLSTAAAGRLKPVRWTYMTRLMTGGPPQGLGTRTLELVPATFKGSPAWLVIDTRQFTTVTLAESLYVSRADLEPLHRAAHSPRSNVVAEYGRDSIHTTFGGERGNASVAMANEPGLLANTYLLELVVGAAPLTADWRTSARLAAVSPQESGAIIPIETHTIGEETVIIPDGSFDCWVVAMDAGASRQKLWVRKTDGVVVKERIPVIGMQNAELELLLAEGGARK